MNVADIEVDRGLDEAVNDLKVTAEVRAEETCPGGDGHLQRPDEEPTSDVLDMRVGIVVPTVDWKNTGPEICIAPEIDPCRARDSG